MRNGFDRVVSIAALAVAAVTLMATVKPEDLLGSLAQYVPARSVLVPAMVLALAVLSFEAGRRIGARPFRKGRAPDQQIVRFILTVRAIRDNVLSHEPVDMGRVIFDLQRLGQSEHSIWATESAWKTRAAFIRQADDTAKARSRQQDFPTAMARREAEQYLNNATDRLIAALNNQKMPPLFDPYEDAPLPPWKQWYQRLKGSVRRPDTSL